MNSYPKKGDSAEHIAAYLTQKGTTMFDIMNKRVPGDIRMIERLGFRVEEIAAHMAQPGEVEFEGLTPNIEYGPLSLENKSKLRDKYNDPKLAHDLSVFLRTSFQNVRLAQRGKFRAIDVDTTPIRTEFGPLSYEEKLDIFENYQDWSYTEIAQKFNTHVNNAKIARDGKFKRKSEKDSLHELQTIMNNELKLQCIALGLDPKDYKVIVS